MVDLDTSVPIYYTIYHPDARVSHKLSLGGRRLYDGATCAEEAPGLPVQNTTQDGRQPSSRRISNPLDAPYTCIVSRFVWLK